MSASPDGIGLTPVPICLIGCSDERAIFRGCGASVLLGRCDPDIEIPVAGDGQAWVREANVV
jgi:hypothetical protein